jgi:hypothetical protein
MAAQCATGTGVGMPRARLGDDPIAGVPVPRELDESGRPADMIAAPGA